MIVPVPMMALPRFHLPGCHFDRMLMFITGVRVVCTAPQQRMQRHGARRQDGQDAVKHGLRAQGVRDRRILTEL